MLKMPAVGISSNVQRIGRIGVRGSFLWRPFAVLIAQNGILSLCSCDELEVRSSSCKKTSDTVFAIIFMVCMELHHPLFDSATRQQSARSLDDSLWRYKVSSVAWRRRTRGWRCFYSANSASQEPSKSIQKRGVASH